MLGNLYDAIGIEIQSYNGIVALGMLGFLLDGETTTVGIELCHAVALGVVHVVAEHRGLTVLLGIDHALLQQRGEAGTMEDVIAQYQTGTVVADELLADDESLGQTVGRGLLGVFEAHTEVGTVA